MLGCLRLYFSCLIWASHIYSGRQTSSIYQHTPFILPQALCSFVIVKGQVNHGKDFEILYKCNRKPLKCFKVERDMGQFTLEK